MSVNNAFLKHYFSSIVELGDDQEGGCSSKEMGKTIMTLNQQHIFEKPMLCMNLLNHSFMHTELAGVMNRMFLMWTLCSFI